MRPRSPYRDLEDRLISNSVQLDNGCWLWIGRKTKDGYGLINVRNGSKHVTLRAHRVAYEEFYNVAIEPGIELDHQCYERACICPNHLKPVSKAANLATRRYG